MTAHRAEVDRADDIDAGISQLPGEGGQRTRFVVKADDEDGPARADVSALHDRLPRLHRLVDDQAHVRSPARRFGADRVDVDARIAQDRRELRELPRPVRDLHVDLDHVPLPTDIGGRGYKGYAPSSGGKSLMGCPSLPDRFDALHTRLRRDSGSELGGFDFLLSGYPGDARRPPSARPGDGRRMGGASQRRVEAVARVELVPGRLEVSSRARIATGTSWTTSRSRARMSSGPTAN